MAKKNMDRSTDVATLGFQIRESYKAARTNIHYSIIKKGCKTIAFTSASKGEGKTVTAVNIATALAQQVDTKVVVIDCDLRRPRVHTALTLEASPGLTNYLNDECTYEEIVKDTKVENLKAITYGAVPPNPSELLSSDAMKAFIKRLRTECGFDYVIFDTPPVGVVIDAIPIIKHTDGVVIVVRDNATTYPDLNKTIDVLKRSESKILGVVVNRTKPVETRKGYKKYSYDYGYGGYYGY